MTLAEVKNYLRVDGDHDDALITSCMSAAETFIAAAVGSYDDTDARAQLLLCAVTQALYDDRQLMVDATTKGTERYLQHMFSSMITQLQVEQMMKAQEGDSDEG